MSKGRGCEAILAGMLLSFAVMLPASPALAEAKPRVRGVVTAIDEVSITVRERDGGTVSLKTAGDTAYAYVVPSSIDAVRINDYVGTAVRGPPDAMVAVELVIVPDSMRAGRESYYGWDPLPDAIGTQRSSVTTSMTNGWVSGAPTALSSPTSTDMTNGTVSAQEGGAAGRMLTVTYDGGKTFQITVPPNAPITRFQVADRSAVTIGSAVFIKTNPGDRAALVAVGKGITPPM